MSKNITLDSSNANQTRRTSYDNMPYESYPYEQTAPDKLMMLAKLFKMNPEPVDVSTAKVLELGCAGGGNIIPHAINYPKAKFVGIDLSAVQIDEAKKHQEALGLKNIEFHHMSITDIDINFGKFDYIICHGVLSWVPDFVRKKIFEVCRDNLNENGLAYISYNTLPGWNMVRSIRDMLIYHAAMFNDTKEKALQSRLLLDFMKNTFEGSKDPHAEVIRMEAELLSSKADSYLCHDHLEDNNTQYYFHEFMKEAQSCGLQYLADTSIASMYVGNMPAKVAEKLHVINDIVRTEQYMDFIRNRRFRCTVLCHDKAKINRNINNNDITQFNMMFSIRPEKPLQDIDLNNNLESLKFFYGNDESSHLSTSSNYMKAILYSFAENSNNPVSFEQVTQSANKKLGGTKLSEIKAELINIAMRLVLQGYINLSLQKNTVPNLTKPKAYSLAKYQVTLPQNWVTSQRHKIVVLNIFEKIALQYMDGKNDKNAILNLVIKHVESGELVLNRDDKKIEDIATIKEELSKFLDPTLEKMAQNGILV